MNSPTRSAPLVARRSVALTGLAKSELVANLRASSIAMNEQAERLFADDRFIVSRVPRVLSTVELRVRDLGFPKDATSAGIYETAGKLGLRPCPLELAAYLRIQLLDQPDDPRLTIASHSISTAPDVPSGFYLARLDDRLWLRGYTASPDYLWSPEEHFVFTDTSEAGQNS